MNSEHLKALIAFSSQKGFIWGPEPEIYGGVSGFYTYGPLGKLLKNRIESIIRERFVRAEFYEVECPIVMPRPVWEASGHLAGFSDPVLSCAKCSANVRADEFIGEKFPELKESLRAENILKVVEEKGLKCPVCGSDFKKEVLQHNLMMKTTIGISGESFLRPETATTTYLPFPRYADFFRNKLPFGVFQIGKAFRNEISPRQYLLRLREFTQAEGQLFIHPDEKKSYYRFDVIADAILPMVHAGAQVGDRFNIEEMSLKDALTKGYMKSKAYAWTLHFAYELFLAMGIPKERIRLRQHRSDEKAFYADDAWDVEVNLNCFGWTEMCGVHDRTDYDLSQHEKFSKKKLEVSLEMGKVKPHVLEIAFGTDRPVFAILDLFYSKKAEDEGKSMLCLPLDICPVQVGVFPLFRKEGMPEQANMIADDLRDEFIVKYDETQSIGKRYLRAAEEGVPFCITVDYETMKDKTVTLRERDSELQVRVKAEELRSLLHRLFNNTVVFSELKGAVKQDSA
jgi:glycyl-tRNA synthetase